MPDTATNGQGMRLAVVIPTFCEEANIDTLLARILEVSVVFRVLVVDDNSPDRTREIVLAWAERDARVKLLTRVRDAGYGRSLRDGLSHVLAEGAQAVATMDADHSHDPRELPEMLSRLADADLVIGSRYVPGGSVIGWPWYRHVLSQCANLFVQSWLRIRLRDCTSGFRVYRAEALTRLKTDVFLSEGYSLLPELARRVLAAGGRVVEHPIRFTDRTAGKSKMGLKQIVGGIRDLTLLRMGGKPVMAFPSDEVEAQDQGASI